MIRQQISPNETAREAYQRNLAEIHDRISQLQAHLKEHQREFETEEGHWGRHWGFPGDLSHYNELLAQALGEEE